MSGKGADACNGLVEKQLKSVGVPLWRDIVEELQKEYLRLLDNLRLGSRLVARNIDLTLFHQLYVLVDNTWIWNDMEYGYMIIQMSFKPYAVL